MNATLYIVATPIGNLGDMTLRAIETLREVDVVLAEDTRVTKKLLQHYDITKPDLWRCDAHMTDKQLQSILETLLSGKNMALVTDAGTPGISDPGSLLVQQVLERAPDVQIVPLPGASSITAALSASGLLAPRFTFLGFLPQKKGRKAYIEEIADSKYPIVLLESPHRIIKLLEEFQAAGLGDRSIVLAREITKLYEEFFRGTVDAAHADFSTRNSIKGEFVVILDNQ
jgi:16S rRNA (cytidine1402-2'-O)-methyltransferase